MKRAREEIRLLRQGEIIKNAASLYGATIVTSIFGFAYWFVAAHLAPATAVGTASAVQSAAVFFAIFCVLGVSTLVLSELAIDRSVARTLLLTAMALVGVFSAIVAVGGGIVLRLGSHSLRPGLATPFELIVFAALVAFSTVTLVADDACIGLLRGDIQLRRNTVFAIVKLAVLPLFLWLWPERSGLEMVLAWLFGLMVSFGVVTVALAKITEDQRWRLNFRMLASKRRLMAGHHWLNVSIQSPRLIISVLVATIISPAANAAYTAAYLMVSFINIIPFHLSTVLFALSPGDESALRREVKKTMRLCGGLALVTAPLFVVFSNLGLRLFGSAYTIATPAMIILGLTTFPLAVKNHYVAIARVRGQMARASILTLIGAAFEVGLAAAGAVNFGLTGVALGYLAALVIEALLFGPTVLRVVRAKPVDSVE